MTTTLSVIFDGEVFRPETLPDLAPNTRYQITLQPLLPKKMEVKDAWDVLEKYAGTTDAPADWSVEHDHYLYGTPKHSEAGDE